MPPVLKPAELDLDPIAPFLAALVVFYGLLALFSPRDAYAYRFVLQRFSEPIGTEALIPEWPIDL